jgi:hypothetical protein
VALVAALASAIIVVRSGAWQAIAAAVIAAGVCAGAWAAAEFRLDNSVSDNNQALHKKSVDPALSGPGDSWPAHFNVDMSDGSIERNGDKVVDDTDWHLKC